MPNNHPSKRLSIFALIAVTVLFLANSSNPPNGRTGAPGDNGTCAGCHGGSNPNGFNGSVEILNFPTTITPGTTYNLTARVNNPNGLANRGGFQAVVLNETTGNTNAGDLIATGGNPSTVFSGGKEYVEHSPAINFPGSNQVTWNFDWEAPSASAGDVIKIYTAAVIGNGSGSSGDFVVTNSFAGTMDGGGGGDPLTVQITSSTDVSCFGGNDGNATAEASDGAGSYSYSWSNGESGATATMLPAGSQSVTVTDANSATATASIMINQPNTAVSVSITNQTNINCNNTLGSATASGSGGTPGYTYLWDNGEGNATAVSLSAGMHSVTATDMFGCFAVTTVFINTDITTPIADAGAPDQLDCNNNFTVLDGSASDSGGNITYLWTTPDGNIVSGATSTSPVVDMAGTYTITVSNNTNGCTASSSTTVIEIPSPTLSINGNNLTCFDSNDGSITLSVNGGAMPFNFDWNDDTYDGIQNPTNIPVGTYAVTLTDGNNCTASINITLTAPPALTLVMSATNETAPGANDGTVTANAGGGTLGYTEQWSNGQSGLTTITNLAPGDYCVTITDTNGCTISNCATVTAANCDLEITGTTNTNILCNGDMTGSLTANTTGGTNPITYFWSNNNSGQTINNLPAGNYSLTATDANGCSATFNTNLTEPAPIAISLITSNVICNGDCNGTATPTVTGGVEPYSYSWTPTGGTATELTDLCPGAYQLFVMDMNNCTASVSFEITEPTPVVATVTSTDEASLGANDGTASVLSSGGTQPYSELWSSGASGISIEDLAPGTYCVTITDFAGCTASNCTTVNGVSCDFTATLSQTNISCNGANNGSATVAITGGMEPFNYNWSTSSNNTNTETNLAPGTVTVTITDNNNCQVILSAIVTGPSELLASATTTLESAAGASDGTIDLTVSGGTPMYTYVWSNGEISEDLSDLSAGTYCVTVTDVNGCSLENCSEVTVFDCTPINISSVGSGNACPSDCNGTIDITVSGGDENFSFAWSNGETTEDLSELCNGNYILTVTDGADCTATQMISISSGNFMINEAITTDVTCAGLCDGMITVTTSSGSGPFSYDWNVDDFDGMTELNDLCPGIYDLTVTDGNGCTELLCFDVDDADLIQMTFTTTPSCIQSPCNGTVSISTTGGTPPYEYSFDTDGVSFCQGEYDITVTDALGCMLDGNFTISESPIIEVTVETIGNDIDGQGNGFFEILVSGGVPGYTFEWMLNGTVISTDEDPTGLSAGEYDLEVTDDNGCSISITDLIIDSTTPSSEPAVLKELKVFPNPANHIVHILLENPISSDIEIVLFDINGTRLNPDLLSSDNAQQWILNVADLPVGLYTLQVKGDGFVWWEKLVLQR